jgi:vancomycin resistance protein YoaR
MLAILPAAILVVAVFTSVSWIPNLIYPGRILAGVSLAGIDLGNTRPDLAKSLLANLSSQASLAPVQLQFNGRIWDVDLSQFDLKVEPERLTKVAVSVGRRGGINQRLYENWAALLGAKQPITIQDESLYDFNRAAVVKFLEPLAADINQSRKDAKLTIKNGRVTEFVAPQDGQELDINQTVDLIAGSILSENRTIDLAVQIVPPAITLADTNQLGINKLLARGESDFSGSPKNRRHNISVGASKFDGLIIEPNTTFSFVKSLGEVDQSTGYLPELVIKGDKTLPEFGGGLCQVSTTAFRGILRAGFPIVERRNHSYRVVYYEPAGSDATIYQPSPDLKFTNDTPGHILIDTYIIGDKLYFDFYGTDIGRTVELEGPRIFNVTAYPDPIYIDTSTLPVGEVKRVDTAHRGADAVLTRKVFVGNKLVKTDVFNSHYVPWPAKYLRGVEDAAPVETDPNNIAPLPATDPTTLPPTTSPPTV